MDPRPLAALLAQAAISVATFLVAKRALAELSAAEVCFARFAGAGVLFAAALLAQRRSLLPPRGFRLRLLALGVLAFPLNQGFFLAGLASTTPAHASLMYAFTPATALLVAVALRHEHLTRAKVVAVALAVVGVVFVVLDRGGGAVVPSVRGDALVLVAMVAWALYVVGAAAPSRALGALPTTSWALLWGALLALPAAPFLVRPPAALADVSVVAWACVAFLAIAASFAGYALVAYALRTVESSRAAVFTNLQPVGTAIASALLLDERFGPLGVTGAALTIAGVWWAQRPDARGAVASISGASK